MAIASIVVAIGLLLGILSVMFIPLNSPQQWISWTVLCIESIFTASTEFGLEIRDGRIVRNHFYRRREEHVDLSQNPVFALVSFGWSKRVHVYTATTRQILKADDEQESIVEVLKENCSSATPPDVSGYRVYTQRWYRHAPLALLSALLIGTTTLPIIKAPNYSLFFSIPLFLFGLGLAYYFALLHVNVKVVRIGSQLAVHDVFGNESQVFDIKSDLELKDRRIWMTLVSGGKKISLPMAMMFMPSLMYDVLSIAQGATIADSTSES